MKNWLNEWWNGAPYMEYRDPVVVFVSYFYTHVDNKLCKESAQRAASLVALGSLVNIRVWMGRLRCE